MKAHQTNLINAIALIIMPLWSYFTSINPSPTALIPLVFGVVLLALNNGVRLENKSQAHAAVILTLIALIALFKPLSGALERADNMAVLRVGVMILTGVVSMVFFIKSFRDARIARQNKV
jgi:CDP-diglyceride synthetase